MNTKIISLLAAFWLLIGACTSGQDSSAVNSTEMMQEDTLSVEGLIKPDKPNPENQAQFKAVGQEPGWSLELDPLGSFSFKSYDGMDMNTPAVEGVKTGNTTTYKASVELGEMIITLTEEKCNDSMSGKEYPFSVTVMIKRGSDKDFKTYKGCGAFVN